jgi:hypothetical protein
MRRWLIAWSMAILAVGLAPAAHADEWNKLTYLTFSGPVNMPGITLPAGTYRFELADPDSSRRVVRVSDKDGSKSYGIFLSISDQKLEPSDKPLVMFKEMPAGAPQAVQAWFYPGETTGYEFVYPHDQALKIAKSTHEPVLTMKESAQTSTDAERVASMKSAEVTRIDENDKPVSTDERLKDSSALHPSNSAAATTTASSAAATTTAKNPSAATTTAQPTTSEPAGNPQSNAQPTTARANTASSANAAQTPRSTTARNRAVGTSGQTSQPGAATDTASAASRRQLPRTASELPLMELLSGLAFAGGALVRALRR